MFDCAEPPEKSDSDTEEQPAKQNQWDERYMSAAEKHSGMGPNIHPEERFVKADTQADIVNPAEYDWSNKFPEVTNASVNEFWESLGETKEIYTDPTLRKENLKDDYQLFFVNLVLNHVKDIIEAWKKRRLKTTHSAVGSGRG